MSNNNFMEDFFFGVKKYRHLLEIFYKQYCYDGRYVFIDKSRFSDIIQQKLKTDTVIQKEVDVSYGIEEKTVAWPEYKGKPHTAFFLETRSCTNPGRESPGWMVTCCADSLLYSFEIKDLGLVSYIINFPALQKWFQRVKQNYPIHTMQSQNRTEGRLVWIKDVIKHLPTTQCFLITFDGACRKLRPDVDIQRLRERHLLRRETFQQINNALSALDALPPKEIVEETEYEEYENLQTVQQKAEEILARREIEEHLQWLEQFNP